MWIWTAAEQRGGFREPFEGRKGVVSGVVPEARGASAIQFPTRSTGMGPWWSSVLGMTHLEGLGIRCNLTAGFIVEEGVPEHEGEVGVGVDWVLVPVFVHAGSDAVDAAGFGDDLGWAVCVGAQGERGGVPRNTRASLPCRRGP